MTENEDTGENQNEKFKFLFGRLWQLKSSEDFFPIQCLNSSLADCDGTSFKDIERLKESLNSSLADCDITNKDNADFVIEV